jgi:DNA-binding response OmpR family regulator
VKVLIADANRPLQSAVRDALAEFGYRCVIATTADEARTALATEQPEILLVDVDLPGLPLTEIQVLIPTPSEAGGDSARPQPGGRR